MSQSKKKQNIQGKESFTRMNFLYQASMLMAGKNNKLSSYYGELCKNISKKSVLRIEPNIKRNLCKRCSLAQQPGLTSDLVIPKNKANKKRKNATSSTTVDDHQTLMISCKQCGYEKKLIVNMNYKFWLENPESIAEICTTQQKTEDDQAASRLKQHKADNSVPCPEQS